MLYLSLVCFQNRCKGVKRLFTIIRVDGQISARDKLLSIDFFDLEISNNDQEYDATESQSINHRSLLVCSFVGHQVFEQQTPHAFLLQKQKQVN